MTVVQPSYRGATVDTRYTPLKHLLQYVDGSPWVVTYYSQVLGADDELSPQQTGLDPVYQQYRKISKFLLRVSSALEGDQDEEARSFNITGSAVTSPGMIPNKGDMFLADVGDGRQGLFAITNTQRLTHLKDTLYSIDYVMKGYGEDGKADLEDLESKVIQDMVFVRDHLAVGERPIITTDEFMIRTDSIMMYREWVANYFADFFSPQNRTLLLPGQDAHAYDPFLQCFIRDIVSVDECADIANMQYPDVSALPGMRERTLWDALRTLSRPVVRQAVRRMGLADSAHWRGQVHYAGVYFTGIDLVVYPRDRSNNVDRYTNSCLSPSTGDIQPAGVWRDDFAIYAQSLRPTGSFDVGDDALPYAVPVTADDHYVFTEKFYTSVGPYSSQLERITHQALMHEPLDKTMLLRIARAALNWPDLERFYYGPVLLALLKTAIQTS